MPEVNIFSPNCSGPLSPALSSALPSAPSFSSVFADSSAKHSLFNHRCTLNSYRFLFVFSHFHPPRRHLPRRFPRHLPRRVASQLRGSDSQRRVCIPGAHAGRGAWGRLFYFAQCPSLSFWLRRSTTHQFQFVGGIQESRGDLLSSPIHCGIHATGIHGLVLQLFCAG